MTQREARPWGLRRALLWAVFGMALLLALCIGIVQLTVNSSFDRAVARYRAAGMPWTADEVILNKVPADKDAGPRLFALAAKFKAKEPSWLLQRTGPLTPKQADELEAFLAPQNKLLDEYRAFAHLDCNWDKDWDEGANLLIPELSPLKAMTRTLAARMELRSYRGDIKGSLQDLRLGARLVRQPGRSFLAIGMMVEAASRSIVIQAAQRSASLHLSDPEVLKEIASAVEDLRPPKDLAGAWRPEAYMGVAFIRNASWQELAWVVSGGELGGDQNFQKVEMVRTGGPRSTLARVMAIPFLKYWSEYGEQVRARDSSLDSLLEITQIIDAKAAKRTGLNERFLELFSFELHRIVEGAIKSEADFRNLLAALRLAELRAGKGSVTQTELANLLPEDPFTHQPMKAELKGGAIKLWSLGPDKTDQGGISRQATSGGPYDLPISLPWKSLVKRIPYAAEER